MIFDLQTNQTKQIHVSEYVENKLWYYTWMPFLYCYTEKKVFFLHGNDFSFFVPQTGWAVGSAIVGLSDHRHGGLAGDFWLDEQGGWGGQWSRPSCQNWLPCCEFSGEQWGTHQDKSVPLKVIGE